MSISSVKKKNNNNNNNNNNCGELHWRWRSASRWVSTIYISLKGLCYPRRMCVPVKTNLKTSARFFKFCRKFWKAVFISFNLNHRLIVSEVFFFIKNRSVVITEEFYCVSFETLCPWFFFYVDLQCPLFSGCSTGGEFNNGYSTMSDWILDGTFLIVDTTFLLSN